MRPAVEFQGEFAAVTQPGVLDNSVVGHDILELFAIIVDRPGDTVRLFRDRRRNSIQQQP
jgi:hypothetical protein